MYDASLQVIRSLIQGDEERVRVSRIDQRRVVCSRVTDSRVIAVDPGAWLCRASGESICPQS